MSDSLQKNIIKPNQRFEKGHISSFINAIRNIIFLRDLVYQLFRRDFFAVYKKSFIGYAWIIASPIAGIISWVFLHKTNIIRPGDVGVPYPVYVLIGTMIWGLFMGVFSAVMNALDIYRFMLMKTKFPHEVIFGTQMLIRLAQFSVSFIITILILLIFKFINLWGILLFPIVVIPLLIFALSLGLLVSILSVISYDFKRMVTGVIGLVMFITPVIYSSDAIKNIWLRKIMHLNPLTYLVCSARDIILYNRLYDVKGFLICSLISILLLIISWRIFYVSEDKIIERMI
jgi:lipopolysaccharide transport system permease protein